MPCPICNKETDKKFTPFCSERCKLVDLNKWLTGSYSVPVVEMDDVPTDEDPENSVN